MCSWGHPPWQRVTKGEHQSQWSDSPADWASDGEERRMGDWGHRRSSLANARSGAGHSARRHPCPIDEGHQLHGRGHRDDLVLGADPDRARRPSVLWVGEPDHRRTRNRRGGALGDHRHVVSVPVGRFRSGVDDGDVTSVTIEQPAQRRRKQPRSHRDEHLERWL